MVYTTSNDLEILWVAPGADGSNPDTDARVPTAQELAASSRLHQQNLKKAQAAQRSAGLLNRPTFTVGTGRQIVLPSGLQAFVPGHPSLAALASNVTIALPALADAVSTISRFDNVYLFVFGGRVTGAIDSNINLAIEWQSQSGTLQTVTKENTQRIRTFWAVVVAQGTTTAASVFSAIPTVSSKKTLTVSTSVNGSALSSTLQIYPLDLGLTNGQAYEVIQETIDLVPLLRVWRAQVFTQNGYLWGRTGETTPFSTTFNLQDTYNYVGPNAMAWEARGRETLNRILLGLPILNAPTGDRAVENLINGQNNANLDAPGIATASPNGSTALANNQRIIFSNQAVVQRLYCLPVQTINVSGLAQASVPFQTNSPAGSFFSQNIDDHKVYSADGRDVTLQGTITGLGGTGSLTWTANSTVIVSPGDFVYMVPGIFYPAGSGFANSGILEAVYLNGTQLNAGNVLDGPSDLSAFQAPAGGQSHIVVYGEERAAVHYIYRQVTVTSNASGVVVIPGTARGIIAFISGTGAPSGRQNLPVITGLSASTSYTLLLYHPPAATDIWQFQWRFARYAGSGESTLLNGSRVATNPFAIGHTQGGGNATYLADGPLQYELISNRLPANTLSGAVRSFQANYRMQLLGEPDLGWSSIRELTPTGAAGLALPRVGDVISLAAGSGAQTRGLSAVLTANSFPMGVLKPPIRCSQIYQLVVGFVVEKAGAYRLVIVAINGGDPTVASGCRFNTDTPHFAALDTFPLY